jgi:RimJ/RimL family protein N-acetyltransferase
MTAVDISFRALSASDFPLLQQWLSEPHVEAWWHQALDLAEVVKKYGPRIDGTEPMHVYIIDSASGPMGFIQWYRWSDYPEHAVQLGAERNAVGIDLAIGDLTLTGRGIGPKIIRGFLDTRVWPQPDVAAVVVDVDARNARSLRAFEKAGFSRTATIRLRGEDFERNVLRFGRARSKEPRGLVQRSMRRCGLR